VQGCVWPLPQVGVREEVTRSMILTPDVVSKPYFLAHLCRNGCAEVMFPYLLTKSEVTLARC
jgi:hypothetical protein